MSTALEEIVFGKTRIDSSSDDEDGQINRKIRLQPVWIDPDDAMLSITPKLVYEDEEEEKGENIAANLSEKFSRATEHIDTSWADLDKATGAVIDAESIFSSKSSRISSERLVITRRADLPKVKDHGGIKKIYMHPTEQYCAYIGNRGTLTIASYSNEATSILFELPAQGVFRKCLCYSTDGARIFVGCTEGKFQSVDSNGNNLFVHSLPGCNDDIVSIKASNDLLAAVTKKSVYFFNPITVALVKVIETSEEQLICGTFSDDSSFFIVAGSRGRGHVITCEKSKIKSVAVFQHEDRQSIRGIDCCGGLVAMGTEVGILVIFNFDSLRISPVPGQVISPKAIVTKMNLTTAIDTVKFNPTGELLIFASSDGDDALKILHIGASNVFSNWPTQKTPLRHVRDIAFSSDSAHLVITNEKFGTMWELPFYKKDESKL